MPTASHTGSTTKEKKKEWEREDVIQKETKRREKETEECAGFFCTRDRKIKKDQRAG